MLDTMTLTKAVASICGAFLILLLGKWAAEGLYHVGGHGEQAFAIEVEDAGGEAVEEVAEVPFAVIYASASAEDGEGLWRACQSCHKLEAGANGVGPYLYGVVGRDKGTASGYDYSEILATMEGDWTPENLDGFLANPKEYAPGTKMGYAGMKDAEDRANLIAYLNTFEGNAPPESYADAAAASTEEAAAEEAPAEEAATEEAATEEAPAAEAPAEDAAAEETPADETPAEEAAAEEAPAEEQMAAADTATEEAPAAGGSGFDAIYAAADADAGERVFRQCASCHKLEDGGRAAGPHLNGVIGRDIASVDGFSYSDALTSLDGAWTPERLASFIANPKEYAPGTKMTFRGLADEQDRANVIAYIEQSAN